MTIDRMALQGLLEKGSDADLLREMISFVTSRMMDAEVEAMTGAAHGERTAERINQRNGYRLRDWHTGAGTVGHHVDRGGAGRQLENPGNLAGPGSGVELEFF